MNETTKFFRMKRSEDTRFIQYVVEHKNNQWFRLFAANLATQETEEMPAYVHRTKTDITQEISKAVFEYETALLKSEVWQQSNTLTYCQILPHSLTDILDSIQPNDTLLLYVFTEECGVCKYTSPIVAHLATKLNDYSKNEVKVLSMYGYNAVLALTNESCVMENLGVPKFYLFEGKPTPTILHNPDLLGNYTPNETLEKLLALFSKKEVAL